MAHFAEIDPDNIVLRVVVIHNNELLDDDGIEREAKGQVFCHQLFGGRWIQTSYNGNFRKNFAASGFAYDEERDAFVPPRPFASWTLDEQSCRWSPPVPCPTDYPSAWDEETRSWIRS